MSDTRRYTKSQSYWPEYSWLSGTSGVYVIASDAKWKCSYPFSSTSKSIPTHNHQLDLRDIIIRKMQFQFTWFELREGKTKLYRSPQQSLQGPLEKLCTSAGSAIHIFTWNQSFASSSPKQKSLSPSVNLEVLSVTCLMVFFSPHILGMH